MNRKLENRHAGERAVWVKLAALLAATAAAGAVSCSTPDAPADTGQDADVGHHDTGHGDTGGQDTGGQDTGPDARDGDDGPSTPVPEGCNPAAFEYDCLLPYPSNVFLVDDPDLPSGRRLALTERAMPRTSKGGTVDFTRHHPADGFSPHMPIMALFPDGVSLEGTVFHTDDPAPTLAPSSKTLVLDAETGEPVAHWVELDASTDDPAQSALIVRLHDRLDNERRYVVALQGLLDLEGEPIEAPQGFAQIRDGVEGFDPAIDAEIARYEADIFPVLEGFGVARSNLQLAWDFTTQSEASVTGDMLVVRDDVLARLAAQPPAVTITEVEDDHNEHIFRRISGTIRVPLYMTSAEPRARLNRDAEGRVVADGEVEVPFLMLIPRSVAALGPEDPPARLIQYGHGFFGLRNEIEYGYMRQFADELGVVTMAVDWWGMSDDDALAVAERLLDSPDEAMLFVDRVHQSMANQLALTEAALTTLQATDAVRLEGRVVYDPQQIYYYGISQGHILGAVFLSLTPHIERAVLNVGGAAYSLMMSRSTSFRYLLTVLKASIPERLEVQKYIALSQGTFDRADPISFTPFLIERPLDGVRENRRFLMQLGIGDTAVPNLGSHVHARAVGIHHLQPAPRPIVGLEPVEAPYDGSAVIEVDFGIDPLPDVYAVVPRASAENEVHEGVRRNARIIEQIDTFLRPGGLIIHPCDGPCDPE